MREFFEEELEEKLNETAFFYPEEGELKEKDCVLDNIDKTPYKLQDKWLTRLIKNDYSDCMTSGSTSYEEFRVRVFSAFTFDGPRVNLADFDGKKYPEIMTFINENGSIRTWSKYELEIITQAKDKGTDLSYRLVNSQSGKNGGSCEKKDSIIIFCELKTVIIDDNLKNKNIYKSIKFNNVRGKEGDTFFSSGTAEFELNNWRGKVTFRGKNTPPTWTATNGKDRASGTLKQLSKGD